MPEPRDEEGVHGLQRVPREGAGYAVGRLQAMEKRLSAMLQAANQMQPALDDFYGKPDHRAEARFNNMQQVAGQ